MSGLLNDGTHNVNYQHDGFGNVTNVVFTGAAGEADTDSDGMPDAWEWVWFGNLTNAAAGDFNQEVNNLGHYLNGTNPTDPDSDHDGVPNVDELRAGTNPTNASSVFQVSGFRFPTSLSTGPASRTSDTGSTVRPT